MPFSIMSHARHFTSPMAEAPIGFVISTTGGRASAYVYANAAYLAMCGLAWSDIAGQDLVKSGAALISTGRQRRLWLLEHVGRYQNETATLRHACGQSVLVSLSARRTEIEGRAVDLEYFSLLTAAGPAAEGACLDPAPFDGAHVARARMKPSLARVLSTMPESEARKLVEAMINTVSRGLMSMAQPLPHEHPVARLALHEGRSGFDAVLNRERAEGGGERAAEGSSPGISRRLLDLATAIWMLARSQPAEIRAQLIALVEPYTVASDTPPLLAKGWSREFAVATAH